MPYDLFGNSDPFAPRPRGAAVLPGDDADLLGRLMEGSLGGLSYFGKILNKTFGGRAVRGVLGGQPNELLSVLPMSDTLGLTRESDEVHGRKLLQDYGLTDSADDWQNEALGVGAEIALDPATLFGAAVPRALAKVGLPAAGAVARTAGSGLEALSGVNPYTYAARQAPNLRAFGRQQFDSVVHGAGRPDVQKLAEEVYDPALKAGQLDAKRAAATVGQGLADHVAAFGGDEPLLNQALKVAEGTAPAGPLGAVDTFANQVRGTLAGEQAVGAKTLEHNPLPAWQQAANDRAIAAGNPAVYATAGMPDYFPRRLAEYPGGEGMFSSGRSSRMSGGSEFQKEREDLFRGFGTDELNRLAQNPATSGRSRTLSDLDVEDQLLKRLTGGHGLGPMPAGFPGDAEAWAGAQAHAKGLAAHLKNLPPPALERGMFSPDVIGAGLSRMMEHARVTASGKTAVEGVGRFFQPVADLEAAGTRYVRVPDFLSKAGLNFVDPTTGAKTAETLAAARIGLTGRTALKDLHNLAIPEDVANDMLRIGQAWAVPSSLAPVVDAYDKVVNLFKTSLTAVFPAFHARNLASGLFNQWRDNSLSLPALKEAATLIRGGELSPEAARAMGYTGSTADATRQLLNEAVTHKVAFTRDSRQVSDVAGKLTAQEGGMLPSMFPTGSPTARPLAEDVGGWAQGFRGGLPTASGPTTWKNPLGIAGVGTDADVFTPVAQMRKLGGTVEDFNRLSHYIARRTMGDAPEVASGHITKYHFDYGDLTQFEQHVMKRLFPWYTFSSKNLPPVLEDLASKPAILAGTTKVMTGSREPGEFVPPWVGEGAAIPIPGAPEGQKRFIASFGSPIEDEGVKTLGSAAKGDYQRVLQQLFGMAQPFVKLPAELATGTQMFSGRKLEDLRPYEFSTLGGLLPEDTARKASQVIANSPLSRVGSTVDKFIDERKGLGPTIANTLTGARVQDVEIDKVRERAAQQLLQQLLSGTPGVKARTDVYVPKDQIPNLSPAQLQEYDLLREIEARAAKRSREAKKAGTR